ncbi:MAG: 6-carboxytetrahydropterin synthase [Burkholderiaceae bacterium]
MYRLAITRDFIARHFLIGGDWGAENSEHSHHYKVQVRLRGESLNAHGYLADIVDLEAALDEAVARFRDRTLNDLEPFAKINPSLERFARVLYDDLRARSALDGLDLDVKLWENERDWAAYGPRPRSD